MDLKERLKMMLGIEENNEQVEFAFQSRLEDGTIVSSDADEFGVGIVVNVVAEDGSVFPLAEGTYIMENGDEFSVDAEGIVTEYTPSEEEVEEVEEEVDAEEDEEYKEDEEVKMSENSAILDAVGIVMKELLEEVKKDLETLRSDFDSMQSEKFGLEEQVESIEKEKEELAKQVVELSEQPAGEPVVKSKFKKEVKVNSKYNKVELNKDWKNMTIKERIAFQYENKK
jgi:hypothetical protein